MISMNPWDKSDGLLHLQAVLDAFADSKARPVTPEENGEVHEPLPPPMIKDNWESSSDKCFIGPAFKEVVTADDAWQYKDEVKT